ncbi:MAG: SpvB/TcaC N-terminal domain-containing protein, partial [Bacteroidota bacterium]
MRYWILLLFCASLQAQTPVALPPLYEIVSAEDAPPAANPANGIALIAPPTANPTGAASLAYPIKLPPARKGHAPVLEIAYSSDHLHGWLGRGWTLSLPAISVETRWGVPRYHPDTETETYLLEGAMLAPVAHRGPSRPRTAELTFYPRVERNFQRITRHGDNPKNYWWKIASPDGTVEYYGGTPDGLVLTAQIRDAAGNTANWALVRSVDVHGNRIDYHYQSQADNGRSTSNESGTNRYPDRITYNGFGEEAGPYEIRFVRDRQLGENRRPDVRIDYEGGYKMVVADLLRRIEITYRGEAVRHYELGYRTGAFRQSLLESIAEYGRDGSELARHELSYHAWEDDDSAFGPAETWNTGNDNVQANILNPIPGFTGEISALGGSGSTSRQIGSAVTVGPIGPPGSKELTVGGTVGSGSSDANGILAFVDINGDQLPDKLFKREGRLVWRKNRFGEGQTSFGPIRPVNDIDEFSIMETSEFNFGFEANITPFFAGYENTTARTTTTTYFNDFNGDDLLDILHKGQVYFNHLDVDGNPTFTRNSGDTPSPIVAGASPDGDLVEIDPDEQQELLDMTPRHDVVRSWEAPCDGTVSVASVVQLVEQSGIDEYNREDGVNVTVELGSPFANLAIPATQLFQARIPANDYAPRTADLNGIPVTAGQRLYFRVQSILDGAFDRVSWDPEITFDGRDLTETDVNGKARYRFRASEDFLLASCQTVAMPLDGRVDLVGTFTKPVLSDTVHLELLRAGTTIFSTSFAPDSVVTDLPVEFPDFQVAEDQELQLRMRVNASVDWTAPVWTPRLVYRSANDGTQVVSPEGEELYSYCPAIDYTMRNVTVRKGDVWQPANDSFALDFLYVQFGQGAEYATLAVRGRDTVYYQYDTLFPGAVAGAMIVTDSIALPPGADVWVEVFGPGAATVDLTMTPLGAPAPVNVPYAVYRKRTADELLLGPQYRGWGQFVYRGEDGADTRGIIEANLRLQDPDIDEEDVEDIEIDPDDPDFTEFEDLTDDPTEEPFVVMVADPKNGNWVGYDNLTLVGRDYQSSSRLGEDDVVLTPDFGTGSAAPPLSSLAKINAVSAGVGFGPASLAGSTAWNTTTNLLEVMDLNGDRYPDIVSPTMAQYTTVYGGLSEQSYRHAFGSHEARSMAIGGTAGGKFVDSAPTNSGDSSGKGSRRKSRKAKTKTKNQGAKAQSANESSESGGSISVNFSVDNDHTVHSWFDINGDGLADKVWDNGDVAFNYGYRFGARENWGFADIRKGVSMDYGGGGGINVSNNSFAAGIAVTRTDNYTTAGLQDMNNDGMADVLSYNPDNRMLRVALNTGSGFAPAIDWGRLSEPYDKGDATSESVNFAFTVCIPIFFIRICVNPSGSAGRGVSRVLSQFDDVDGDGFPDEVTATRDNEIRVRRSTIGKVNLLKEIRRPLGATIALDYEQAANDYGLPFAKWLLTEVRTDDGVTSDGPGQKTRIIYDTPNHDRHEREFYGFAKTTEEQLDTENGDVVYRRSVAEYRNDNFYSRNLPVKTYVEDAEGNRYRETVYSYLLTNPNTQTELSPNLLASDQGRAFPLLTERTENFYDGAANPQLIRRTAFTYDSLGQVLVKTDFGDGTPEDELQTAYVFHPLGGTFKADRLKSVKVYGGGELLRHREMDVDARGNITQQRDYLDENTFAARDYTYDAWGNVLTYQRPPNATGERMTYTYEIDTTEHMYPVRTEDSYGYVSTARYEFKYGQLLEAADINGHTATYTLDEHGRVSSIKLPKDSVYSYRYTYRPDVTPAYATTERYDPEYDTALVSHVFLDGMGRTIQEQHQSVVEGTERLVSSGAIRHDAFGRPTEEGYPQTTSGGAVRLHPAPAAAPTAKTVYDVLDRPVSITLPDGATTTFAYSIVPGPDGQLRFQEAKTDALGFRETTLTDERGQDE